MTLTIVLRDFSIGFGCALTVVIVSIITWEVCKNSANDVQFLDCLDKKRSVIMREQKGAYAGEVLKGCIE